MTWYNDMVIFNNLSPLQLNKYLYHFCRWLQFLFTQNFINRCSHLHYFANLLWTRLFSCNIFNEHFYRVPHFWPQRSHYPLFAFENYFWKYKTENIASFTCYMPLYLRKSSLWRLTPCMPQGKRGKFTIPGHETARNRHTQCMANSSLKKKKKKKKEHKV